MTSRRLTALTLAALVALALTACTDDPPPAPSPTTSEESSTSAPEPTDEATTSSEPEDAVGIPECEDVPLEDGEVVDGEGLADCMAAAMIAAGSGSQLLTTSDGVTEVDFEWTPELALHAQGTVEYVIRGDVGWLRQDGRWIEGDSGSSDPEEAHAGAIIELSRAFGDPRGMVMLFSQTAWDVIGQEDVPDGVAAAQTGLLLRPEGPLTLLGVTLSDVELWLDESYLGLYFIGTGQFGGISETTTSTFTQWGQPVDVPDPGAE